jgi:thymidylate kinase
VKKDYEIILLEGYDGSGKSSVGKLLSEKLGYEFIDSPRDDMRKLKSYVNENLSDFGKYYFYMAANHDLSDYFKRVENDVVCSRYYYSSIIDYSARFGYTNDEFMKKFGIDENDFFKPTKTILLSVSEEEQRNRILERNQGYNVHSDLLILTNSDYQRKIRSKYKEFAQKKEWDIIDTTGKSVDFVVDEIILSLNKYCNGHMGELK